VDVIQPIYPSEQNSITTIYGVVTTGTNWKFLRLQDQLVEIDLQEYYVSEIEQILGILNVGIGGNSFGGTFKCAEHSA